MGVLFQFFGIINCFLCLEGLLKGLFSLKITPKKAKNSRMMLLF